MDACLIVTSLVHTSPSLPIRADDRPLLNVNAEISGD
jgi:hypothetical protein